MIIKQKKKETVNILYKDWPSKFAIEFPADLIIAIEGMLETDEEAAECLLTCAKMQGGTSEGKSSNENVQTILDWYRNILYEDDDTDMKKYADKVRYARTAPDLMVVNVYKKEIV